MGKIIKVCHMTSAHNWNDVRIFMKMCHSLSDAGYDVYLVAAGDSKICEGIHIIGCGEKPVGRKARMGGFAKKIYQRAKELDCDVYHFHDPELLPYGIKLKKAGKVVIFDSHEDVPEQIMSKYWIPAPLRWIVSKMYKAYESYAVSKFDAVVTATPAIAEKFVGRAKNVVVINNYPKLDDIVFQEKPFGNRNQTICYAGGIDEIRGIYVMLQAINGMPGAKLVLAGPCEDAIKNIITENEYVQYLGVLGRYEINCMYGDALAGLVVLQPLDRYKVSQPIKMYEYMAAGLPVIASDFTLWKQIIEDSGCGICVNPTDASEVRKACVRLLANPDLCKKMGLAGRKCVEEKYNWVVEEKKLLKLYKLL